MFQVTELAEAKWENNPFKKHYLKKVGRAGGYVFMRKVCSCGKKSNSHCKGVLCAVCCLKRGEPCKAHRAAISRAASKLLNVGKANEKAAPKERKAGPKKGDKAARKAAKAAAAAALVRP